MSIEPGTRLRRAARTTYRSRSVDRHTADLLLFPLTLLMLMLFLFGSVPGASDMIAEACTIACLP